MDSVTMFHLREMYVACPHLLYLRYVLVSTRTQWLQFAAIYCFVAQCRIYHKFCGLLPLYGALIALWIILDRGRWTYRVCDSLASQTILLLEAHL